MRAAVAVIALAGCGRIAFDALGDGGVATGDGEIDAAPIRKTLRLDKLAPGGTLLDYTLPVVLDDTRADRSQFAADRSDLRFYDSSGNVLAHEIEQAGAVGGAPTIAWVRVPSIAGLTTTIDLEYGAPPRATGAGPAWSSDFVAVYHFPENLGADSTGRVGLNSVGAATTTGQLGGGVALGGTQYLVLADSSGIATQELTVTAWANVATLPTAFYAFVAREVGATSDDEIYLGLQGPQVLATCEHANNEYDALGGTAVAGQWLFLAEVISTSSVSAYLNGTQVATVALPGPSSAGTNPLFIGGDSNFGGATPQNDFAIGTLDEIRIALVPRSASYLSYENAAMRDQVISY